MMPTPEQVFSVLREFNPWWIGRRTPGVHTWRRAAFGQLRDAVLRSDRRAVLLGGARQVGKTTMFLQVIEDLLGTGHDPAAIVFVALDHPILKLAGLDAILRAWEGAFPAPDARRFIFIDEIQHHDGWLTWLKHRVDFQPGDRIAMTGSALRLAEADHETALGRFDVLRLPTLSFYEYLRLRGTSTPDFPAVRSLARVARLRPVERLAAAAASRELTPHFHEYLLRGGFPALATEPDIDVAQRRLRQDIVETALKRDMTAIFGIRNILQLDKTFLYLCFNDGGIVSAKAIGSELGVQAPTVENFLAVLHSAHLIRRMRPLGYGKQVLRSGEKVYIADPAIPGAIMMLGRSLLEDPVGLGRAVENAFSKHVAAHHLGVDAQVSYWQDAKKREVDLVAQTQGQTVPFEVKYRDNLDSPGLQAFCADKRPPRAYIISRDPDSLGTQPPIAPGGTAVTIIPAPLACYWLGHIEQASSTPSGNDW